MKTLQIDKEKYIALQFSSVLEAWESKDRKNTKRLIAFASEHPRRKKEDCVWFDINKEGKDRIKHH